MALKNSINMTDLTIIENLLAALVSSTRQNPEHSD